MDEDWTGISDVAVRKRIQNRLAQRKHRQKAQEQANRSKEGRTNTADRPQMTMLHESPFHQTFVSPTGTKPIDSSNGGEDTTSGGAGSNEYSTNDFTHSVSFVGNSWNPNLGDSRGARDTQGSIENIRRDVDHTTVPRSHQNWRRTSSSTMTQNVGAGATQALEHLHRSGQALPAGLDAMSMYPEAGQWLQQLSPDSPIAEGERRHEPKGPDPDSSADERDHCCQCGHQNHRKDDRRGAVPTRSHGPGQALPAAGPAPPSQSRRPSSSSLIREHGIDLAQLTPRSSSSRRDSPPAAQMGPGPTQSQSLKRRFSDANAFARNLGQGGAQQDGLDEKIRYEMLRRDEYVEDSQDWQEPKVTKVVIIYMQERERVARNRNDRGVGTDHDCL